MRFLESWTVLPLLDLIRLTLPVAGTLLMVILPGRRAAGVAAALVTIGVALTPDLIPSFWLQIAWVGLWLALTALTFGGQSPKVRRLGFFESSVIGMILGVGLLVLLLAAIERQALPHDEARRATIGLTLLALGLLHLMMRRHTVRAGLAFAALGLGLQVIEVAAWGSLMPGSAGPPAVVWFATLVAVTLAVRIGHIRERVAGSPWVGDAHDLHD
jgi:hypothetical protein